MTNPTSSLQYIFTFEHIIWSQCQLQYFLYGSGTKIVTLKLGYDIFNFDRNQNRFSEIDFYFYVISHTHSKQLFLRILWGYILIAKLRVLLPSFIILN